MKDNKITYLDYQATTPVAGEVLDAMLPYFTKNFGNPHSTQHDIGAHSAAAVERAREKVAKLVNCDPDEIIFTSGATESNNFAIKSIAENYFEEKPQIITARTEHKCVIESCHYLEKKGYDVKYLEVNQEGLIDLKELEQLLKIKKSLVSIMHTNNEIGVVQPTDQIALMCDLHESIYHCDAAQTFSWNSLDVKKNAIHAVSISGHKFYAPKGIGALYIKRNIKNVLKPLIDGGGQEQGLRSGTLATPLVVGLGKAADMTLKNSIRYYEHYMKLQQNLISKLNSENIDYEINGSLQYRSLNNLNISIKNLPSSQLIMGQKEVAISSGSACTTGSIEKSHVLTALGLDDDRVENAFRISFGRETTEEDLDHLIAMIKKINTH
jgi:cysteine desulfurase